MALWFDGFMVLWFRKAQNPISFLMDNGINETTCCMHVRMHVHGCMHAAGMPVYAGGMRNIEYRTKLRRTAQEQLGFSISSSRSSKYAQSVHTAQKNATHACLATAHFWAPPSMAM